MAASKILSRWVLATALAGTLLSTQAGCDNVGPRGTTSVSQAPLTTVTGTVVFRENNGGFFGVLTDNGGQLEPMALDPQYQQDGVRIKLMGRVDNAQLGKHGWGNAVSVDKVQKL